jgi:hypothetical protein
MEGPPRFAIIYMNKSKVLLTGIVLIFFVVSLLSSCREPTSTSSGFVTTGSGPYKIIYSASTSYPPDCPINCNYEMPLLHAGAELTFSVFQSTALGDIPGDVAIYTGVSDDLTSSSPGEWITNAQLTMSETGVYKVFAKASGGAGDYGSVFTRVFSIVDNYPPSALEADSPALWANDPVIKGWASGYVSPVDYGTGVEDEWKTPEKALGKAGMSDADSGNANYNFDIVSIGAGGSIVLTFDSPVVNGVGYDFAVYENSIDDSFLELAFVEVSSDGETFVRFDSVSLTGSSVSEYGAISVQDLFGFAGTYRAAYGTPFDLFALSNKPEVKNGSVDLENVTYIRIIDIIGDGSRSDSFGNPIYDPYPNRDSVGFDLDAVALIH